jgi:A/G-specific adenine glycosylase
MLQQTPVNRVLPQWKEWMQRWPSPQDLAGASTAEVLTAWGRLGYPRRALRLHECAKIISSAFDNEVPRNEEVLRTLPGVGEYTAAAISAFAFDETSLVLDVNIRRFFERLFDGNEFPTPAVSKSERAARKALVPSENAHLWAAATMELGALICTARKPSCEHCPVKSRCVWRANGFPISSRVRKAQTWNGSDRQCRGVIVQALRENKSLTELELKKLWSVDSQLERALSSLSLDGLISITPEGAYSLPS